MITTTLNAIHKYGPCAHGWVMLLAFLGKTSADDEPLPLVTILESNGLYDALWALRTVTGDDARIRRYAVWCAQQVQHLMTDTRSLRALEVTERHVEGLATDDELEAAREAAGCVVGVNGDAAHVAAKVAVGAAAGDVAWHVALYAARAAAGDVPWDATRPTAWFVARDAARAAMRERQIKKFREVFGEPEVGCE